MTLADVVIVGGGFAGMCAARALANGRRSVVVLEALSGPAASFRGELMHPLAVDALSGLGLLGPLRRAGATVVDGFAVALEPGEGPIRLPYGEIADAGGPGLVMSHPEMVECLRQEVARAGGVELRRGSRVTELVREGGPSSGSARRRAKRIRAPLTIVSDGRHSKLRRAIGAAEETRLLSFTAAVLTERVELPCPRYGHVFLGSGGPILAYALASGRVRLCIDVPLDIGKKGDAVLAFVRSECAPAVPEPLRGAMLRAIAETGPELCATHAITTRRCMAPGLALVGDSGGCAHPLTAGGMTIALHDVRTLAEELDRAGSVDEALERYQARRYAFVRAREILVDMLYDLFCCDDGGARTLRKGLLRYWRSGTRARGASLSLLSGRESRLSSLLAEYASVVGASALNVLTGKDPVHLNHGRRVATAGLARTAVAQLARAARLIYLDRRRRPAARPWLRLRPTSPPRRMATAVWSA